MKIVLILFAMCSGCIQFSVDESSVCDTEVVTFRASPFNPGVNVPPITQGFVFSTGVGKEWLSHAMIVSGSLELTDGSNFSFLDELMIEAVDPNGNTNNDLVLWDVQHPTSNILQVIASDRNLINYIDGRSNLIVNITVSTQQPPMKNWDLNVNLCVKADLEKQYGL